jgi:hypothetical protein
MSGKALLPGFGDDEEDTESQITQTVGEVSQLFKQAQLKMKLMGSQQGEGSGEGDEVLAVTARRASPSAVASRMATDRLLRSCGRRLAVSPTSARPSRCRR